MYVRIHNSLMCSIKVRAGLIEGKKNEKKLNEKTENRAKEYVSFIGQIVKI